MNFFSPKFFSRFNRFSSVSLNEEIISFFGITTSSSSNSVSELSSESPTFFHYK
jgi:hypothetical protein